MDLEEIKKLRESVGFLPEFGPKYGGYKGSDKNSYGDKDSNYKRRNYIPWDKRKALNSVNLSTKDKRFAYMNSVFKKDSEYTHPQEDGSSLKTREERYAHMNSIFKKGSGYTHPPVEGTIDDAKKLFKESINESVHAKALLDLRANLITEVEETLKEFTEFVKNKGLSIPDYFISTTKSRIFQGDKSDLALINDDQKKNGDSSQLVLDYMCNRKCGFFDLDDSNNHVTTVYDYDAKTNSIVLCDFSVYEEELVDTLGSSLKKVKLTNSSQFYKYFNTDKAAEFVTYLNKLMGKSNQIKRNDVN